MITQQLKHKYGALRGCAACGAAALMLVCLVDMGVPDTVLAQEVAADVAADAKAARKVVIYEPLRELNSADLSRARALQDEADLLQQAFTQKYSWRRRTDGEPQAGPPDGPDAAADLAKVLGTYEAVIKAYPHTEEAAYATKRLAGAQQYAGQAEASNKTLQQMAKSFVNTKYEKQAYMSLGLQALQRDHDAAAAEVWFNKILPPVDGEADNPQPWKGMTDAESDYFKAQLALLRVDTELGEHVRAEARAARIGARFPDTADHAKRELQTLRRNKLGEGVVIDLGPDRNKTLAAAVESLERDEQAAIAARPRYILSNTDAAVDALRRALKDHRGMQLTEAVRTSLKVVEEAGLNVVDTLKAEHASSPTDVQRSRAILLALQEVGNDRAKQAVAAIAMDDKAESTTSRQAAEIYKAMDASSDEMAALLDNRDAYVQSQVAHLMNGMPLTRKAAKALSTLLASDEHGLHIQVAQAYGMDPADEAASLKVTAMMNALPALEQLKAPGERFAESVFTNYEYVLLTYAQRLSTIRGGEKALARYAEKGEGLQPLIAVVALGMRGDATQHDRLRDLVPTLQNDLQRYLAVLALSKIATPADLLLFETLAANDPFSRTPSSHFAGRGPEAMRLEYPIRNTARATVERLKK